MSDKPRYHAIQVDAAKCFGCTHCMKICPAEAIRIRKGIAVIDPEKCVDCGNCLRACPADAFYIVQTGLSQMQAYKYRVVLFPSVFIGQFPLSVTEDRIYEALLKIGFTHIMEVEQPALWLMESIRESAGEVPEGPLISSFCPAIVRLIQSRYPSLAGNISRRRAPHDLAARFALQLLNEQGALPEETGLFYVTPCSAKMAAVNQPVAESGSFITGIIGMRELYNQLMKVLPLLNGGDYRYTRRYLSKEGILWSLPRGESAWYRQRSMAIDGIHNVVKFLERLENDDVPELDFLELRSCSQGCAGGILLTGNRFLTVERLQLRAAGYPAAREADPGPAYKEVVMNQLVTAEVEPGPAFLLDTNRVKALQKLEKINKILGRLPAIDCGSCGAPNCRTLAEDIVKGAARITDCFFLREQYIIQNKINRRQAQKALERIWGPACLDRETLNKKGGYNESE